MSETRFSEDRARALVEARTRALAQAKDGGDEAANDRRVILCAIGDNLYGLPLDGAQHVAPLRRLTAAPGGRGGYLGLTGERGRLYDVFDLGALLSLAAPPEAPDGYLVLLKEAPPVALRIDALPVAATVRPMEEPGQALIIDGGRELDGKTAILVSPAELIESFRSPSQPPGA